MSGVGGIFEAPWHGEKRFFDEKIKKNRQHDLKTVKVEVF